MQPRPIPIAPQPMPIGIQSQPSINQFPQEKAPNNTSLPVPGTSQPIMSETQQATNITMDNTTINNKDNTIPDFPANFHEVYSAFSNNNDLRHKYKSVILNKNLHNRQKAPDEKHLDQIVKSIIDAAEVQKEHTEWFHEHEELLQKLYVYVSPKIYKKKYDEENQHLPIAMYANDYISFAFDMVQKGDIGALDTLINSQVVNDILNIKNERGDTLLLHAVKAGKIDVIQYLLNKGCDNIYYTNKKGLDAVSIALVKKRIDILETFKEYLQQHGLS